VLVLSWYDRMRPVAGAVAFAVLFSLFAGAQLRPRPKRFTVPAMLAKADPAATIIIQSPMRYLELAYNAPVKLSSRLYYLASPADSLHYTNTDNDDRGLLLLQEWAPLRTEAPTNFLMSHRQFLVWCDRGGGWIMRYLADKDARIALLETNGAEYLFKVTISDNAKL
jgi:hypothetical protein